MLSTLTGRHAYIRLMEEYYTRLSDNQMVLLSRQAVLHAGSPILITCRISLIFSICKGIAERNCHAETETDPNRIISRYFLFTTLQFPPLLVNRSTNWDGYRDSLDTRINLNVTLRSLKDLDRGAELLHTILLECVQSSTV